MATPLPVRTLFGLSNLRTLNLLCKTANSFWFPQVMVAGANCAFENNNSWYQCHPLIPALLSEKSLPPISFATGQVSLRNWSFHQSDVFVRRGWLTNGSNACDLFPAITVSLSDWTAIHHGFTPPSRCSLFGFRSGRIKKVIN